MQSPATPGWGVHWCWWWVALRHSWLRVLVLVPPHSWLGSVGRGGGRFSGVGWGVSRVVCVCGAPHARGVCVGVCVLCLWCLCWWWCGCGCVFRAFLCVCVCVCGVLVACGCRSVVPPGGVCCWLVWPVCVMVGLSPLLAEAPECDFPPLLAGFRCRCWSVFLAPPGSGPEPRFAATPGWGPLAVVVCGPLALLAAGPGCGSPPLVARGGPLVVVVGGPSPLLAAGRRLVFLRHSWLRAPGAVPRHFWLGSAGRSGGRFLGVGCRVPRVVCAGGAARARGVRAGACVVCSWCLCWWCGCMCVCCVCLCVCVCVCGLLVVCGCRALLSPGWGLLLVSVGVWLVCVVIGPSPLLAEAAECHSPPLLAGLCCRWWWVFLATPG